MTQEQEKSLRNFEALVRQLMMAYEEKKRECDILRQGLEQAQRQCSEVEERYRQLALSYDHLRTARLLEVSGDDVKESRQRLSRLIREVDKCIALLNV